MVARRRRASRHSFADFTQSLFSPSNSLSAGTRRFSISAGARPAASFAIFSSSIVKCSSHPGGGGAPPLFLFSFQPPWEGGGGGGGCFLLACGREGPRALFFFFPN